MLDFYNNYKNAVTGSGVPGADEALVASVMSAIADRCARFQITDFYQHPATLSKLHCHLLDERG